VTPIDATIERAADPAVSSDGKTVAYVGDGDNVWLVSVDGRDKRQVGGTDRGRQRPAFAPDGRRLAVVSFDRGLYGLPRPVTIIDLPTGNAADAGKPTDAQDDKGDPVYPPFDVPLSWVP
jgi:Tol biopolymer transport system component